MNTLLNELAFLKSEESFRSALCKIGAVSTRSDRLVGQAVYSWLESCQKTVDVNDFIALYSLKNKLKTYLKWPDDNRCVLKIEEICLSLLPPAYTVDAESVPRSCRSEMSYVRHYIDKVSEKFQSGIFELLNEIPGELGLGVINVITYLFAKIATEDEGEQVYEEIKKIPLHERTQLMTLAAPFILHAFGTKERLMTVRLLHQIPYDRRNDAVFFAAPYLVGVKDGALRAMLVFAIHHLPDSNKTFDTINKLVLLYTEVVQSPNLLFAINYLFDAMPPGDRPYLIEILTEKSDDTPRSEQVLLDKAEHYVILLLQYYLNSADFGTLRIMAEALFRGQKVLQLHDSHPLFLQVIASLSITNDAMNPKNPFHLYKMFQEEANVSCIATTHYEEVGGSRVSLNSEVFIKNTWAQAVTFDQLPKDLPPQFFSTRFIALKAKIVALDPVKKEQVLKEIKDCYGASFTYLFNNIVFDPYIQSLEMMSGQLVDVVPVDLARYVAIVKYLYDHEDTPVKGKLLSTQEELLLTLSASIQGCPEGKKEGCTLFYNNLPSQYRYCSLENADVSEVEKALKYIQSGIQDVLDTLFSCDNAFLKELADESNEIQQLAHVSTFVKNRIGSRVGLMHQFTFDPHTELLYDPLVEKSLKETLDIFYKHATPSWLVQELKRLFNRDKMNVNGLITHFNTLVESKLGKAAVNYETMWQHDEEYTTESFFLTDEGARKVLQAAGYLAQ